MFAARAIGQVNPVTYSGSNIAQATTVTIPTHNPGDMIVIWAYSQAITIPTKPSGWTTIDSNAANSNSAIGAYRIATTDSHTSGTWTNAQYVISAVFTGAKYIGGYASNGGNSNIPTCSAITLGNKTGSSQICAFFGQRTVTTFTTNANFTRRESSIIAGSYGAAFDTRNDTTTDGQFNIVGGSQGWQTLQVELRC